MRRLEPLAVLLLSLTLAACGEAGARNLEHGGDGDGEVDPGPGVSFDPGEEGLCQADGEQLTLIARRIDCAIPPPAPCTLKTNPFQEYTSGAVACPTDFIHVEVEQTGVYDIELVVEDANGESRMCLDDGPVLIDSDALTGEVTLEVDGFSDGPC